MGPQIHRRDDGMGIGGSSLSRTRWKFFFLLSQAIFLALKLQPNILEISVYTVLKRIDLKFRYSNCHMFKKAMV